MDLPIPKLLIFVILPLLIITLLALLIFVPANKHQGLQTINYSLEGKSYKLLVADSLAEWEKGLMYYKNLDGVSGMIFLFPDKEYRSFWNKNTLMNLNIYWLDDEKVVGKSFLPSIEKSQQIVTVNSPTPVNKVVEMVVSSK